MEVTSKETVVAPAAPATPAQSEAKAETPAAVPATQPEGAQIPEGYEYNGDRSSVPEPLKKFVAGIDRYMTKKSQAFADLEKKAREHESLMTSEDWKQYQQFKAGAATAANPTTTVSDEVTEAELDAIAAGDRSVLQQVIDRRVKAAIEPVQKTATEAATKQKELETAEMIKAFADVHTDFWNLFEAYEPYMVDALKSGRSLETVHSSFKELETKADARADARYKAAIEAKKAGSTVGSTPPGTPDVVYAENENEAKRLAIQMTLKGDKRQVAIKK
jgi:hypothetical protein